MQNTIVVDVGNLRTKIARVKHCSPSPARCVELSEPKAFQDVDDLNDSTRHWTRNCEWIVGSVNPDRFQQLNSWVRDKRPGDVLRVITSTMVPLKTDVENPERTGVDRLLAAFAATKRFTDVKPIIVIDAGTAVTVDLIDAQLVFCGGNIFPGMDADFRQLNSSTALLPLAHRPESVPDYFVGRNTHEAIFSGVIHSQIGGIRYLVDKIENQTGPCNVVATGGFFNLWTSTVPDHWHLAPNLVLEGIAYCAQSQVASSE
ncbi:MAG: type III pantothenate kinase [Pirellulaceae bacterium]